MSTSTAIIPYVPPISAEEFIRREVEKGIASGSICTRIVAPISQPMVLSRTEIPIISETITRLVQSLNFMDFLPVRRREPLSSHLLLLGGLPLSFEPIAHIAPPAKLDGEKIAEALQSELAVTQADDARPIVATYGCGSCVAVGGYDSTNKIAFVVHFANAVEVRKSGGLIFYNISKLVKDPISTPIQLHLRGGHEGQSEATIEAIKIWMRQREDLPMKIASEDILTSGMKMGKSLSIDSRTGEVSEYSPLANAKCRDFSEPDVVRAMMSAFEPTITLAYSPHNK